MCKKRENEIVLFEAFSGIGSQFQALKNLGYHITIAGISEWHIDALIAYGIYHLQIKPVEMESQKMINFLQKYSLSFDGKKPAKCLTTLSQNKLSILFQMVKKFGKLDIRDIGGRDLIDKKIDIFTYSFPCQDISRQGKQQGLCKERNTHSSLLWEIVRILGEMYAISPKKMPKILLMENVPALLQKKFQNDFGQYVRILSQLGYRSTPLFKLNAMHLGEVQKRDRVFMVSYLQKTPSVFVSGHIPSYHTFLADIFQNNEPHDLFITHKNFTIQHKRSHIWIKRSILLGYSRFDAENCVYFQDSKCPTLTASGAYSRIKIWYNKDIVYLNAFEYLLLQGFTHKAFYNDMKAYGISDKKVKFLAGNSIHIKVLEKIFDFYIPLFFT